MSDSVFEFPERVFEILQAASRLQTVEDTGLTGSKNPEVFKHVAASASLVMNAPVAQVTLLQEYRQIIKHSIGFDISEAPTDISFCAYAIALGDQVTVICDTQQDGLFKYSPYVVNPPHVRFYAGCPIIFRGERIGTVCIYDFEPRETVSDEQLRVLKNLAGEAAKAIEDDLTSKN